MKIKLLFLLTLCSVISGYAQCGNTPPPPGINPIYAVDTDNDGHATFDFEYYITNIHRVFLEGLYGFTSAGYDFSVRNNNFVTLPMQYTNTTTNEQPYLIAYYNGNGPTYGPLPPCYWPAVIGDNLVLVPVPYNQDMDGDGILNVDEDTNRNINLMDDDDDHDGIINLKDASNTLSLQENSTINISIYPNPITNGVLTFESDKVITKVALYDLSGKELVQSKISSNVVTVDTLAAGIYFVKFQSEGGSTFRKVVIN